MKETTKIRFYLKKADKNNYSPTFQLESDSYGTQQSPLPSPSTFSGDGGAPVGCAPV